MILVKNWNFPLRLFLDKLGLEIMFADHPVRKIAFLDEKNISILHSGHIWIVSQGQPMILFKNWKNFTSLRFWTNEP